MSVKGLCQAGLAGLLGWAAMTGAWAAEAALSAAERLTVVDAVAATLRAHYMLTDQAGKIAPALQKKARDGAYETATTKEALARALTADLVAMSGDLHFFVGVDPQWISTRRAMEDPARRPALRAAEAVELARTNFGFTTVSRLEGNVGYLNLAYFADPDLSHDTAAAAMRFIGQCDAVIIDLRYNNGGHLEMAQFIASYFFRGDKDQLLFDYSYTQDGKRIDRGQWVLPALPGPRLLTQPLYVLTGSTSFSSAEWFSVAMKKLGRATLVGARTAGGAHPVDRKPVDDAFFLQTPIGQIRDPVDRGDFEGVGVAPDVAVPSVDALAVAHQAALDRLGANSAEQKAMADWVRPVVAARLRPPVVSPAQLQAVVGQYGGREIVLENGTLFYLWNKRFRVALAPLSPDLLSVEGVAEFRYRLVRGDGKVVAIERVHQDGGTQRYERTG